MSRREEIENMLADAAARALDNKVKALCVSMASFIAEIDSSSADVAAYIEQRLDTLLRHPATRLLLDRAQNDLRKLKATEASDKK